MRSVVLTFLLFFSVSVMLSFGQVERVGAQTATPPLPKPNPFNETQAASAPPASSLQAALAPTTFEGTARLNLSATLAEGGEPITKNVIWRIFGEKLNDDGKLPLLATSKGGKVAFDLSGGRYFVHAAFGHAGRTERVDVNAETMERVFNLKAGGLRMNSAFADGDPVPLDQVSFDVYLRTEEGDKIVVQDAASDELIRLNAGKYHVVSKYGEINSEARADLEITPAKLTDVTIYQKGAEITLKLVSEPGGDALANTSWSIMTPAGETIVESIVSPFPSVILATGEYAALARHEGEIFTRNFKVENGIHTDVEVLLETRSN